MMYSLRPVSFGIKQISAEKLKKIERRETTFLVRVLNLIDQQTTAGKIRRESGANSLQVTIPTNKPGKNLSVNVFSEPRAEAAKLKKTTPARVKITTPLNNKGANSTHSYVRTSDGWVLIEISRHKPQSPKRTVIPALPMTGFRMVISKLLRAG